MPTEKRERLGKRANGEGSYRERPNGTWECRVTLPNGKRKSIYAPSFDAIVAARKKAERDIENGRDLSAPRQTLEGFLNHWLSEVVKPTVRASTYESYAGHVKNHLIPELGKHRLEKLTPQDVQSFLTLLTKKGLSPRTVTYARGVLRQALGQALKWGLVTRNVAQLTTPPRNARQPVKPLNPEQVRALLDASKNERMGPLYHVAIATGLRQGELLGLRWEDVDLEAGTLSVRHALQSRNGKPELVEPKTEKSRRALALAPSAVKALRLQRVRQAEDRLKAGPNWKGADWELVFASTIGTPLNASNVTHGFQETLRAAGLPRQRFHDLRHCCASLLLAQNVPARVVMEQLGHSQISLTMNTYSHVMPTALRQAADAIEVALG